MALSNKKRLLAMIGRPKKVATKQTRTPTAPTRAPALAQPTQKPAPRHRGRKLQGNGIIDKLERENDVDYYVKYFTSA